MFDFSTIPKYCINLKRRPDRKQNCERQFEIHGLTVEFIEAIDAITLKDYPDHIKERDCLPNYANILSHIKIIEKAESKYTCIFEDDILFFDDFADRIKYVEQSGVDFDIFYIGGWFANTEKFKPIDRYLFEVKEMFGSHGYILKNTTYNYFAYHAKNSFGMDQFLSDNLIHKYKAVTFLPMMAGCEVSYSDIAGRVTDYNQGFKSFGKERIILC